MSVAGVKWDPLLVRGEVSLRTREWVVHDRAWGDVGGGAHRGGGKTWALGRIDWKSDVLVPHTYVREVQLYHNVLPEQGQEPVASFW